MSATAQQILDATNDAILALIQNGAKSYTMTTGDTVRTVTKLDLPELRAMRDEAKQEVSLSTVGSRRNFAIPRRPTF